LSYCSLHATKVFILADGTVQLVRPKCSFWGDIFTHLTYFIQNDIIITLPPGRIMQIGICVRIVRSQKIRTANAFLFEVI